MVILVVVDSRATKKNQVGAWMVERIIGGHIDIA